MELIFPVAAYTVLCSVSVARKMLVTYTSVLATAQQCLHSIKAVPQPSLLTSRVWGGQDLGTGCSQDRWSKVTKGIFHGTWHLTATHAEILLPTEWLDIICWWEVVNKSFVFLCSCFINCLYPDSSSHLPVLLRRGEVERLGEQLVSSQGQSTTCAKNYSMENMSCITQEIWPWILLLSVVTVTKKKNVRFFCLIFGLGSFFACESP